MMDATILNGQLFIREFRDRQEVQIETISKYGVAPLGYDFRILPNDNNKNFSRQWHFLGVVRSFSVVLGDLRVKLFLISQIKTVPRATFPVDEFIVRLQALFSTGKRKDIV
jgi:hypothetical protein